MNIRSGSLCLILISICTIAFLAEAKTQTLFRYGKQAVSKDEFLRAYSKNNSDSNAAKLSYADYLDLYVKFKIKVQAALDEQMDTLKEQKNELQAFRYQLAESFLKEDAGIKLMVDEAAQRSLKDIRLSCIFIPLPKNASAEETNAAETKIREAAERVDKGEAFNQVASAFNTPGLGWITTFVLPYQFENEAYNTLPGKLSAPFQTARGFYVIKNEEERKAQGKIRIAQILLAYPPQSTPEEKAAIAKRADSLYHAILQGSDFGKMAEQFSNDIFSYKTHGEIPAFGIGQYDPVFENVAFSIPADGEMSKPFETSYGYHILLRLQRIPVPEDLQNKEWQDNIKEKVTQSDRMQVAQDMLVKKIRDTIKKDASPEDLKNDAAVLEYYRTHLEKYNPEFAEQFNEFRQGNLLFAIMQKNVWDAASIDSTGLANYYNANKDKYSWENSADALIITCTDPRETERSQSNAKDSLPEWRKWVEESNGMLQADSGRFELSQIPVAGRTHFTEGLVTAPVINDQDSSRTFARIITVYNGKEPKRFDEAKGSVINDYQEFLEQQWMASLKKKYPVKVNKKTMKQLPAVSE